MKAPPPFLSLACFGLCWCLCQIASPALCQEPAGKAVATPDSFVDISAEESLEWHQDKQLYVARGKARAQRDDMVIEADYLTAHARKQQDKAAPIETKAKEGNSNIDRLTAQGNVYIHDSKQQVYGDKAVYDMDQKKILITGAHLKYQTETSIVTSRDSLEFYENDNIAIARGQAVAEQKGSRIEADKLIALFSRPATGQMEMKQIRAEGNVILVTKDGGVSRGEKALYNAKKETAILAGHVKITRDQTQLAGDKAEVNFATGKSRLLNSGSGRVRALLHSPEKKGGETQP